ncbi:hypothetical protein QVD17_37528 [Tagetes erecta]|uniref:Uncharacterized protein n=1 Tax=Tagetes erecta TaxID=13708 RepID=A0AAD8NCS5_TARER|nr:hypothetical protein QVD17_37528 [Tagetes erecta]
MDRYSQQTNSIYNIYSSCPIKLTSTELTTARQSRLRPENPDLTTARAEGEVATLSRGASVAYAVASSTSYAKSS